MRVMALSSSRVGNSGYLKEALPLIKTFLGDKSLRVAFVPFAAVNGDYEAYVANVRKGLSALPNTIDLVTSANAENVLRSAEAVMVGGGNTFKLLHDIYQQNLFSLIQQKVVNGTPYIGWSAGSNLAGRTICTTNDMPIIQPKSFDAFNFLPFQINPHYRNVVIEGFHGETRDQRLQEFLALNPAVPIVGLPEGTALWFEDDLLRLVGREDATLFQVKDGQVEKINITERTDLSYLIGHKS